MSHLDILNIHRIFRVYMFSVWLVLFSVIYIGKMYGKMQKYLFSLLVLGFHSVFVGIHNLLEVLLCICCGALTHINWILVLGVFMEWNSLTHDNVPSNNEVVWLDHRYGTTACDSILLCLCLCLCLSMSSTSWFWEATPHSCQTRKTNNSARFSNIQQND